MNKSLLVFSSLLLTLTLSAQVNYHGFTGNMVSGDFDNDGLKDDIAAFNTASEIPSLNLWIANQGWINEKEANCALPFDFLDAKSLHAKIVAGDFDNDGFEDDIASIYEIGYNQSSVTVWLNNNGKFEPAQWWYGPDFDANQTSQTIVSGDFDNDGFVDDIAAFYDYEQMKTKVFVWKSDGKKFNWPGTWWIGNDFNSTKVQGTIVSGDFDHDGYKDDIATLYNYVDGYCKAFVWTSTKNKFRWPYTWYAKENFHADKVIGNVISGDFDQNGFEDNIAALYKEDEKNSSILVFERGRKGFNEPEIWWYGNNEATITKARLTSIDLNENKTRDQFTGLIIDGTAASMLTWTASNKQFNIPEENWSGIALAIEDCEKDGNCLENQYVQSFEVYPNPSNGAFTIDIPSSKDQMVQVAIYNMLGSLVYSQETPAGQQLALHFDTWDKGTYVIQIIGNSTNLKNSLIIE